MLWEEKIAFYFYFLKNPTRSFHIVRNNITLSHNFVEASLWVKFMVTEESLYQVQSHSLREEKKKFSLCLHSWYSVKPDSLFGSNSLSHCCLIWNLLCVYGGMIVSHNTNVNMRKYVFAPR